MQTSNRFILLNKHFHYCNETKKKQQQQSFDVCLEGTSSLEILLLLKNKEISVVPVNKEKKIIPILIRSNLELNKHLTK